MKIVILVITFIILFIFLFYKDKISSILTGGKYINPALKLDSSQDIAIKRIKKLVDITFTICLANSNSFFSGSFNFKQHLDGLTKSSKYVIKNYIDFIQSTTDNYKAFIINQQKEIDDFAKSNGLNPSNSDHAEAIRNLIKTQKPELTSKYLACVDLTYSYFSFMEAAISLYILKNDKMKILNFINSGATNCAITINLESRPSTEIYVLRFNIFHALKYAALDNIVLTPDNDNFSNFVKGYKKYYPIPADNIDDKHKIIYDLGGTMIWNAYNKDYIIQPIFSNETPETFDNMIKYYKSLPDNKLDNFETKSVMMMNHYRITPYAEELTFNVVKSNPEYLNEYINTLLDVVSKFHANGYAYFDSKLAQFRVYNKKIICVDLSAYKVSELKGIEYIQLAYPLFDIYNNFIRLYFMFNDCMPYYLLDGIMVLYEISNIISSNDAQTYYSHFEKLQSLGDVFNTVFSYQRRLMKYAMMIFHLLIFYAFRTHTPVKIMDESLANLMETLQITNFYGNVTNFKKFGLNVVLRYSDEAVTLFIRRNR